MTLRMAALKQLAYLTCLVLCMVRHVHGTEEVFNVTKYAASCDGSAKDNSKAFIDAWNAACQHNGPAIIVIPKGTFPVGPIDFKGPCASHPSPSLQILGELKTPSSLAAFSGCSEWIKFRDLHAFVLNGGGVVDGQGAEAWSEKKGRKYKKGYYFPVSLRFVNVVGGHIANLTLRDSKGCHLTLHETTSITIDQLNISAAGDSPNTDGIHMSTTQNINITNVSIGTGDDCISIGAGSINVSISDVTCGPGHGISVGSLGKYQKEENVVGVKVKNCIVSDTTNGLRIKTWPASPPSEAFGITFEENITRPSRVRIHDVAFSRVKGTTNTPVAVTLACSSSVPCENVKLQDIDLDFVSSDASENITSSCSIVTGKL